MSRPINNNFSHLQVVIEVAEISRVVILVDLLEITSKGLLLL